MAENFIPILKVDVYFSRARRFVTLDGPGWPKPLAFNHLEQALEFLIGEDCQEAMLIAGDYEMMLRFAGQPDSIITGHVAKAEPPGPTPPTPGGGGEG